MKFIKLKTDKNNDVVINLSNIDSIYRTMIDRGVESFTIYTNNNMHFIRDERYTYDSFIDMLNKEYGFINFDK